MNDKRKNLLLFFSSTTGKMQLRNNLHNIIDFYTKQNYLVTVSPVKDNQHVYSMLISQNEKYDLVVCAGGEDTLNKTISGILDAKIDIIIEYIAFGSVIASGKYFRITPPVSSVLDPSANTRICTANIGAFNDRYLIYIAAFGVFTQAIYNISLKSRNLPGDIALVLKGIKAISELKSYPVTITYDDKYIQDEFIFGMIINSFFTTDAGNPRKDKDSDRTFNMLLIKAPHNLVELSSVITALAANKMDHENIEWIQASEIHIESSSVEWLIDGEFIGKQEGIILKNHQQAIRMLIRERTEANPIRPLS